MAPLSRARRRARANLLGLPEVLLEAICCQLPLEDVLSLAATSRAAAPLHYVMIAIRVYSQRNLTERSSEHLQGLISRLPPCTTRQQLMGWVEKAISFFRSKCQWDELHLQQLQLLRAAAASGADVALPAPVVAARDAATCRRSCDWHTAELLQLCVSMAEIAVLACLSPAHRASLVSIKVDEEGRTSEVYETPHTAEVLRAEEFPDDGSASVPIEATTSGGEHAEPVR